MSPSLRYGFHFPSQAAAPARAAEIRSTVATLNPLARLVEGSLTLQDAVTQGSGSPSAAKGAGLVLARSKY